MERYQRQMMLPEIGNIGQEKLRQARLLVVGGGGLSATLLPQLIGSGIGYVRLYDEDHVALHNLHRQTLFTRKDIGKSKVICLKQLLHKINPDTHIDAIQQLITASNLECALLDIDLVVDAADNFVTTYILSDACYIAKIPFITASVVLRKGYVGGFCCTAPSYRAIFPCLSTSIDNCSTVGVMGSAVAVLGAFEAQMALSVILGLSPSPLGCLVNCDFTNWHFSQFRFDNVEELQYPQIPFIDRYQLLNNDCIVELRSYEEAPTSVSICVKRILPQEVYTWQPPVNRRIVLVCSSGVRAIKVAMELIARGFSLLAILAANYS